MATPEGRGSRIRFALLIALALGGFVLFRWTPLAGVLESGTLLDRLREHPLAPALFIGAYALLCPLGVPVSPLVASGGVLFGLGPGTAYNFLGAFAGSATSYGLARFLGRDFVSRLARGRLQRAERRLRRQSFWTLVQIRFIPIPFPVVNFGAALAGVPATRFLAATAVGLLPAIAVYTQVGAAVVAAAGSGGEARFAPAAAALAGLVLLTCIPRLWIGRKRRRRLADLSRQRSGRRPA
ncbi:MAG: VTT domain-containing protein [Acidobacteriota bacterium]